jgi:hypothetical protein
MALSRDGRSPNPALSCSFTCLQEAAEGQVGAQAPSPGCSLRGL